MLNQASIKQNIRQFVGILIVTSVGNLIIQAFGFGNYSLSLVSILIYSLMATVFLGLIEAIKSKRQSG